MQVGRVRDESREAHEREARLLREARDAAMSEAQRAQADLRDLRAVRDLLQAQHAEVQQRNTMQVRHPATLALLGTTCAACVSHVEHKSIRALTEGCV